MIRSRIVWDCGPLAEVADGAAAGVVAAAGFFGVVDLGGPDFAGDFVALLAPLGARMGIFAVVFAFVSEKIKTLGLRIKKYTLQGKSLSTTRFLRFVNENTFILRRNVLF